MPTAPACPLPAPADAALVLIECQHIWTRPGHWPRLYHTLVRRQMVQRDVMAGLRRACEAARAARTARTARLLGFETWLLADACATFSPLQQRWAERDFGERVMHSIIFSRRCIQIDRAAVL